MAGMAARTAGMAGMPGGLLLEPYGEAPHDPHHGGSHSELRAASARAGAGAHPGGGGFEDWDNTTDDGAACRARNGRLGVGGSAGAEREADDAAAMAAMASRRATAEAEATAASVFPMPPVAGGASLPPRHG